jgi:uncharacterized RDD family membrane protein YckC
LLYCRNCGEEISKGATYCSKCGTKVSPRDPLVLASWGDRVIAWLIDMILLSVVLGWLALPGLRWMPRIGEIVVPNWVPFIDFGLRNLVYFVYWMLLEGYYGQSLGKMIMGIKVTDIDGGPMNIDKAAIQSIGKAFLLPLDCILGWILYLSNRQRLFNYLSETLVLKKYKRPKSTS